MALLVTIARIAYGFKPLSDWIRAAADMQLDLHLVGVYQMMFDFNVVADKVAASAKYIVRTLWFGERRPQDPTRSLAPICGGESSAA